MSTLPPSETPTSNLKGRSFLEELDFTPEEWRSVTTSRAPT